MASVLAAVPVAAADEHPERDYTATFSACEGVTAQGFEDVPSGHSSAGAIDCIAYYGVTMGTGDGSTYSPSMSVTREQMALFLTRLADVVGIEMASNPDDAGFVDIGELSAESQTAINQLADLGITVGTGDGSTYSPAGSVTRGQMALFIARLMDKMDPFDDGNDATDPFAYIPKQVKDVPDGDDDGDAPDKTVKSPFTDLDRVTKETYDAITALWELGVASGINATSYGPSSSIIRSAMADFMAGVLDHSNARPAGITAQVTKTTGFGAVEATMAVSARDDELAPLADASIAIFTASAAGGFDDETGKCLATNDSCDWSDTENYANDAGNYFQSVRVDTTTTGQVGGDVTGNMETSESWYAWMGSEDNSEFVKGSSGEAMVTLTATPNALGIRVTSDLPENNTGEQVDLGTGASVVITAQLIDAATATADANPVAKEGVELKIERERGAGNADQPGPDAIKTDADGKVMFTITGPADDESNDSQTRDDKVTFTGDVDGADPADDEEGEITIQWRETDPATNNSKAVTDASYVIVDDGKVSIRVTVNYYDQYGNPGSQNDTTTITINSPSDDGADGEASRLVRVRANGSASFRGTVNATAGTAVAVTVGPLTIASGSDAQDPAAVLAVRHAHKNDDGQSGNRDTDGTNQVIVDADNDRFIIDSGDADSSDARAGVLYSYDSGDTFIVGDKSVDIDMFEKEIATNGKTVTVIIYTTDGISIFSVENTTT
ncbi:MAG: S-layer homology domain-containing protein [Gemmatimonadetes bacterium]|nr:S-layer homology domain-containing protein [Gemmatimonadota bacterium]